MLFHSTLRLLANLGIKFVSFYWYKSNLELNIPDKLVAECSDYHCEFLSKEDIKLLTGLPGRKKFGTEDMLLERLRNRSKCFGTKLNGDIIAFTWIDFDICNMSFHKLKLKNSSVNNGLSYRLLCNVV